MQTSFCAVSAPVAWLETEQVVKVLTNGGPVDQTHVFATWAFTLGIWGNDIPLGASVSLFMFPILAVAAALILRNIRKRGNEA